MDNNYKQSNKSASSRIFFVLFFDFVFQFSPFGLSVTNWQHLFPIPFVSLFVFLSLSLLFIVPLVCFVFRLVNARPVSPFVSPFVRTSL